jgi:hypothetical protein
MTSEAPRDGQVGTTGATKLIAWSVGDTSGAQTFCGRGGWAP